MDMVGPGGRGRPTAAGAATRALAAPRGVRNLASSQGQNCRDHHFPPPKIIMAALFGSVSPPSGKVAQPRDAF